MKGELRYFTVFIWIGEGGWVHRALTLEMLVWISNHQALFTIKAPNLVKWLLLTWSLMWWCQLIDWLKTPCEISEWPIAHWSRLQKPTKAMQWGLLFRFSALELIYCRLRFWATFWDVFRFLIDPRAPLFKCFLSFEVMDTEVRMNFTSVKSLLSSFPRDMGNIFDLIFVVGSFTLYLADL